MPTPLSTSARAERWLLPALLLVYLLLAVGYAIRTPAWQAPDEPAHYNYVAQLANEGCCPVIEPGDWDDAYLETIKAQQFAPDLLDALHTVEYEDHQPPLYYLLSAPVYSVTGGSLLALRLVSVVFGLGVVVCAYGVGRALLPDRRPVALATAAFVALLPQHLAILGTVNNDSLAELIVGATLWLLVLLVKGRNVPVWLLGLLVGVGLLTKMNTIFLAGLVPVALLLRWWPERRERGLSPFIRDVALFALVAFVLSSVWWARNVGVYGWPDLFGLGAHDAVVTAQLRTADFMAAVGLGEYLRAAISTTYHSFWGQFGWLSTPLQPGMYTALTVWLGVAGVGLLLGLRLARASSWRQGAAWALVVLALVVAFLQYVYYNTEFVQFQGRYLFPGLIPFALLVALGLDNWRVRLARGQGWLAPGLVALLVPLNVYILWRVLPLLNPPA